MTKEVTEIEVEVLEIDGAAPVESRSPAGNPTPANRDWQDWRQWQGRMRKLDSRWWPLWVFLGILAVALILTVGLFVALVFGIIRLCLNLLRALFR